MYQNVYKYKKKLYPFESTQILTIPARTVTTFYIPIKNTEKSEGYVPRLHFGEGIYAGDAIVEKCLRNLSDDDLCNKILNSF